MREPTFFSHKTYISIIDLKGKDNCVKMLETIETFVCYECIGLCLCVQ